LYYRDYDAIDIDLTGDILTWSLNTNATFLQILPNTGNLSGFPLNSDVGSYWVNITVSDGKGGYDSVNFTLIVGNINDRPVILIADITQTFEDEFYYNDYEADDFDPTNDVFTWTLITGPSFLTMNTVTGELNGTPDNGDVGLHDINLSLSDGRGAIVYREFFLEVVNVNDAPVLIGTDIIIAYEDELYICDYDLVDVDDTDLTCELITNASWLTFETSSHSLRGTPTNDDIGWYNVNISVKDSHNSTDYREFILTVENVNDPPFWVDIPSDVVILTEHTYTFDVNASDIDSRDSLTYAIPYPPTSSMSIDSGSGVIQWTPTENELGEYIVHISVTDGFVTIHHEYIIEVITSFVNTLPTATLLSPADQSELESLTPTLEWKVEDLDGDDIVVDLYLSKEREEVDDLKPAAKIQGAGSGIYSIVDPLEWRSIYYWTVIPHDGISYGICNSGIWTFSFLERTNRPPIFISSPDENAFVGTDWSYSPVAIDPDADPLIITLVQGPKGMTLTDGILKWIPTSGQVGENYQVKLEASDGFNRVTQEFMIDVISVNLRPIVDPIPNQIAIVGEIFSITINASDPDGDMITFNKSLGPLHADMHGDGTFVWTPTEDHIGTHNVTIIVSDGKDIENVTFMITVIESIQGDDDSGKKGLSDMQPIVILMIIIIVIVIIIIMGYLLFSKRTTPKQDSVQPQTPQIGIPKYPKPIQIQQPIVIQDEKYQKDRLDILKEIPISEDRGYIDDRIEQLLKRTEDLDKGIAQIDEDDDEEWKHF